MSQLKQRANSFFLQSWIGWGPIHWWRQSSLFSLQIQMLTSSRHTLTDISSSNVFTNYSGISSTNQVDKINYHIHVGFSTWNILHPFLSMSKAHTSFIDPSNDLCCEHLLLSFHVCPFKEQLLLYTSSATAADATPWPQNEHNII